MILAERTWSDGKIMMWRSAKEKLESHLTVATVLYEEGNMECWDYFSVKPVFNSLLTDGNISGEMGQGIWDKYFPGYVKNIKYE